MDPGGGEGALSKIIQHTAMTAVLTVDYRGEEIMQQPERNIQHAEMNTVPTGDPGGEEIMQQPEMIMQ